MYYLKGRRGSQWGGTGTLDEAVQLVGGGDGLGWQDNGFLLTVKGLLYVLLAEGISLGHNGHHGLNLLSPYISPLELPDPAAHVFELPGDRESHAPSSTHQDGCVVRINRVVGGSSRDMRSEEEFVHVRGGENLIGSNRGRTGSNWEIS